MKVLVLGCGPAGLMACHAAAITNNDVIILSKSRKSYMRGAQYLHQPIPIGPDARPADQFTISYELRGSVEDYSAKVYPGAGPNHPRVSPEELPETHKAWDIRQTYDWLWDTYGSYVKDMNFDDPERIDAALQWAKADLVISTIPATLLCLEGHTFTSQTIWSSDKELVPLPDNTVVCNGERAPAWYRAAKIHGWCTTEWPAENKPPIPDLHQVTKPIKTNCNCFHEVRRMGRYGRWTKGVLSHSAFYETLDILNGEAP